MRSLFFACKLLFSFAILLYFFSFTTPTVAPKVYALDMYGCKCDDSGKSASFSCDGQKSQTCEKASDGQVCWQQSGKASDNGQKKEGFVANLLDFNGTGNEAITVHDIYCSSKDQGPQGTVDANDWTGCKCNPDGSFTCAGGKHDTCEKPDQDKCVTLPGSTAKNKNKSKDGKEYNIIGVVCADKNTWQQCHCEKANTQGDNKFHCDDDPSHHSSCEKKDHVCVEGADKQGNTKESDSGKDIQMIGISCQPPVWTGCTCDAENDPKKNTFKCTLNGKPITGKCESNDYGCGTLPDKKRVTDNKVNGTNVSLEGIQCVGKKDIEIRRRSDPTLPPPPSPPCVRYDKDGRCLAVQTSFAYAELGQFPTDPAGFITRIFAMMIGISGAIGTFIIIRAGYIIMTSQGKPESLQKGREELVAAIVGLIFLILSFVALQVIGVDILHIPEFK